VPETTASATPGRSLDACRVISAEQLVELDSDQQPVLIIDLSSQPVYGRRHIPGAIWFDFKALVYSRPPVAGLMPDAGKLGKYLGHNGLTPAHRVVAYDDENGLKACRLLWTLDAIGHPHSALLDGGLEAWQVTGLQRHNIRRDSAVKETTPEYPVVYHADVSADRGYIESRLDRQDTRLLDARSGAEFRGNDQRAARAGHIPGAINIEWNRCLDPDNGLYLRPPEQLITLFSAHGITPDREVICYCHTHRRSAFMYIVLKHLGYPRVRGYPGSWSEWGNLYDAPVE
jgi:thiosulfate/3-mercaptopyruvate sulfurtransferase